MKSLLRGALLGALLTSVFATGTAVAADETGTTPKRMVSGHGWLPRDHFRIERGLVQIGNGEPRERTQRPRPLRALNLDARLWIPGVGCSATSASMEIGQPGGIRSCMAAGTARNRDWVAVALSQIAADRPGSLRALTS